MTKILISGSSIAAGAGLPDGKTNSELFVNRLATQVLGYDQKSIDNISDIGADNKHIFLETAIAISKFNYSHVLVQWQSIPRINMHLGLETWPTRVPILSTQAQCHNIDLVGGQQVPGKKIIEISNFLLRYSNLHWEILDLIRYINLLVAQVKSTKTQLYFINYYMPWEHYRYFNCFDWNTPSELDLFTQFLLESDVRSDADSKKIYQMIHDQYQNAGGLQESYWLNLYNPLNNLKVDQASPQDKHPGIKSQQLFFDQLAPLLAH